MRSIRVFIWLNRILWGATTSGRWMSNFWLGQAVFIHLPEVKKQSTP